MTCIIGIGFKKAKNPHLAPQNVAAKQKCRTILQGKESS
ncbi:hypothetical protein SM0020_15801 [Sinorhizobium meliloti CCNWSX0020]|jgi:hypothetical protein|uniref:Uncharacterized protein n=1 Tax=Sinorhizobium meliloti CCNWSX0020 TaxID=1107881 RepID=H0G125_RHIML|nr:hypothetical protein SM0020_15801 [Sinorhizobium meliloti CCNWSX0020]PII39592.1 hypothetical protein T190_02560 [Sinorhizobium meliloti CCBAU 01290]